MPVENISICSFAVRNNCSNKPGKRPGREDGGLLSMLTYCIIKSTAEVIVLRKWSSLKWARC